MTQVCYNRFTKVRRVKPVSFLLASGGAERDGRTMKRLDLDVSDNRIALLLDDIRHGRHLAASEESMADGMQTGL